MTLPPKQNPPLYITTTSEKSSNYKSLTITSLFSTDLPLFRKKKNGHGRERERTEQEREEQKEQKQQQEAKAPTPKRPSDEIDHDSLGPVVQEELRCERAEIRRPVRGEILHDPASLSAGASEASVVTGGETEAGFDGGVSADELHGAGPPRVAHPDIGPRDHEVKGCRVRVRVRAHEGPSRSGLAHPAGPRRRQSEAPPRPRWHRNGQV